MTRTVTLICCLVAAVGLAFYIATHPFHPENRLQDLQLTIGYGLLIIIFFLGFVILADVVTGKIDLSQLLTEHGGGASMSRFQLLIFTFVIGLSLFLIVAGTGKFPASIPKEVLMMLGISATTYGVSKGIQAGGGLDNKDGSKGGGASGGQGGGAPQAGAGNADGD
jgi:hypothetical protein